MALVQDLRALTWTAWMVEANTHAAFKESVDLMRIGKAEIEANPDGIALGGPLLEAMALMGLLSREQMLNPASGAFRAGIDKYRPIIATAMGYGWIVTPRECANRSARGRPCLRADEFAGGARRPVDASG